MQGTKSGRRRQQDHVDVGGQQLFVGVQAHELPLFRNIDATGRARVFCAQSGETRFEFFGEHVRHRHQLDAGIRLQRVVGRSRATTTAAYETNFDALSLVLRACNRRKSSDTRGQRGRLNEITP